MFRNEQTRPRFFIPSKEKTEMWEYLSTNMKGLLRLQLMQLKGK